MASKIYWTMESLILIVGLWLNQYAHQRMGLYRHLIYKRTEIEQSILASDSHLYWWLASGLLILLALFAIYRTRQKIQYCYRFSWRVHWGIIAFLAVLLLVILQCLPNQTSFLMLPYFVIYIPLLAAGNLIGCLLIRIFHSNQTDCH